MDPIEELLEAFAKFRESLRELAHLDPERAKEMARRSEAALDHALAVAQIGEQVDAIFSHMEEEA